MLACMFSVNYVHAQQFQGFQVRVIVDQLNVRPAPPKFTLATIFTFKYQVSPPTHQVRSGAILSVHAIQSVGNGAEWLNISFTTADGVNVFGWVYAGRAGSWVNVERMNDQHGLINKRPIQNIFISFLNFIVPQAHASSEVSQNELEGTEAPAPYVLLVILFNVILFLGAMFIAKKIYNDGKFLMFTGVCTLLIEGVVTEAGLWSWLQNIT